MPNRRDFLSIAALLPLASVAGAGPGARLSSARLPAAVDDAAITADTLREAERLAGISFTDAERLQMLRTLGELRELLSSRAATGALPNELAPAEAF
ncbi:MAG: hypothetical protein ACKOGJ_11975, partial [Phycisphaerales bacterium]